MWKLFTGFCTTSGALFAQFWPSLVEGCDYRELTSFIPRDGTYHRVYDPCIPKFLNQAGVRTDFVDYVVDANPHKQGHYLPGTRIPIHAPERIRETRPDYVMILPWNLADEIVAAHAYVRDWGGRFVIPVPEPRVID